MAEEAAMTLVQLQWLIPMDDHRRPDDPLWKRFEYPNTKAGLLLWKDGRVVEVASIEGGQSDSADFRISANWYGDDVEDWQAAVLANAGYTLVPIPSISEPITGG